MLKKIKIANKCTKKNTFVRGRLCEGKGKSCGLAMPEEEGNVRGRGGDERSC